MYYLTRQRKIMLLMGCCFAWRLTLWLISFFFLGPLGSYITANMLPFWHFALTNETLLFIFCCCFGTVNKALHLTMFRY